MVQSIMREMTLFDIEVSKRSGLTGLSTVGVLGLVLALLAPANAHAIDRWQQVPGTAVWMTVPSGWKAVGHRHKHALLLTGGGTSDSSLVAEQSRVRKLKAFVAVHKSELQSKLKGSAWQVGKDGGWILKKPTGRVCVVLHAVRLKGWNIAISSSTHLESSGAVSSMHTKVLSGLKIGWKRPKPATMQIPGTHWTVKHPEGDWVVQSVDSSTIHWGNSEGNGTIQVGRFSLAGKNLRETVEIVSRGMAGTEAPWSWTDTEVWRGPVPKQKGVFRRGESTLRRNRQDVIYRLDVFGFLDGNTAVMIIGTSYGDVNSDVSKVTRKLSKSFRKSRK